VDNNKDASGGTVFGKFSPKEAVGCVMATFKTSGTVHLIKLAILLLSFFLSSVLNLAFTHS
jgi:hypothetical protein